MECTRLQNKIKLLFEKLVQPNYVLNTYCADGLINKLSNCDDPEISFLERVPLISDLIVEALRCSDNVDNSVKVFLTRMMALVLQKELHFVKIFAKMGDKILEGMRQINSSNMNASLRVAYMEVALSIVKHNSGITWLLETGVWKEILSLCNEKRTVFVVRQTYRFAADFMWKLNELEDEANIKVVLGFILKPVQEIDLLTLQTISGEDEKEMRKTMEPMVNILLSIVSVYNNTTKSSILINNILKDFNVPSHLYVMMDYMRQEDISLLVAKLLFTLNLVKPFLTKPITPGVSYDMDDFLDLGVTFVNTIQNYVQRRCAILVLDYCTSCHMICRAFWKDKESLWVKSKSKVDLHDQILFIIIVPLLVFVTYGKKHSESFDESMNNFTIKLLEMSCEHTTKFAYAMRDLTVDMDTFSIILYSVKKLTSLKNNLNDVQANLVFQALFYVLRVFEPIYDDGEPRPEVDFDDSQVQVISHVIDTVQWLVKCHNINWHESVEIICLYYVVNNILHRPNLTCKFVVGSLNVISLTVKKFLTPNLTLLLETKPGSSMHELGNLLYTKLHDMHWEIRDTALELLHACTEISFVKFPPFQRQIMESKLINVSATIAMHDHEPYVQASALKCLGAATKMANMWEQLTSQYPNIQDNMLFILRNNTEGIVRKEACSVLCEMYQNLKLTAEFKHILYKHMVSSAVSDFHWEVQLTALKFWKVVYQNLLTDQGMLDGTFPPVTFSRHTRKIVTLNEAEIQRRLLKILDEFAAIGGLTVFVKLLHDDSEVEIMDNALTISLEFLDILNKYKVPECLKPNIGDITTVDELMLFIKEENDEPQDEDMGEAEGVSSDNVIESILNVDDINLLSNIYERHMHIQSKKVEVPLRPKTRLLRVATPYLFVSYLKSNDFKSIIQDKRKWSDGIRSVSSLLDDVLGIYEVNEEANSLDCY